MSRMWDRWIAISDLCFCWRIGPMSNMIWQGLCDGNLEECRWCANHYDARHDLGEVGTNLDQPINQLKKWLTLLTNGGSPIASLCALFSLKAATASATSWACALTGSNCCNLFSFWTRRRISFWEWSTIQTSVLACLSSPQIRRGRSTLVRANRCRWT